MRLIDADVLYEKTAEWEAQALHMVETTMHDEDDTKWRRWSTILTERTAFKHDIADAPTIEQPEIIRCKDCKHCEHWYADKGRCFLWAEGGIDVFEDGFCNYAERRTDE